MERYRLQCEHLCEGLEECEEKLASFEIQEEYHVADLRKQLSSVKKLLLEERKRSGSESQKLGDVQSAFGQVFKEYQATLEGLKQLQDSKKSKPDQQRDLAQMDSMTSKLMQVEESLRQERVRNRMMEDKMRQMEMDVEAIPILKAQVEVYQSDFNAERAAREKIAGEKADLEEEVQRIRQRQQQIADDIEAIPGAQNARFAQPMPMGLSTVRNRVNQIDDMEYQTQTNRFY